MPSDPPEPRSHPTEIITTEEALRKSNRALQTISECHQALIRTTHEADLLHTICQLVVEVGGYRMAWVGYAEDNEAKTVRPMAQAGFEVDYLEALEITWAATELGRGPTGMAIRTGQPCSAQDMLTEPDFAPWREQALKRGYAASLALPLSSDGQTFGALSIYSDKPAAFDAAETELLTGLANDLARGISALRTRAERKRTEEALRDSEARLHLALDAASMGTFDWDLISGKIIWSSGHETLFGMAPGSFDGTFDAYAERLHPEDVEAVNREMERCIEQKTLFNREFRVVWPDRSIHWVVGQGQVSFNAGGKPERMLGVVRETTERKRAEEELHESERKYRELVENANSIILRWGRDGVITFMNEFGQKFFGYSETEIVGRHVLGTIVPEGESTGRDLGPLMEAICREPRSFERNINENIRRNGERVWIDWTNKVVLDATGQVVEILSIGSDITERRRAEDALRQAHADLEHRVRERTAELAVAKDRAEAADRLKSAFLATMSHELRTPLNSIIGFTGIILQELPGPLNPEQSKQLGMVRSSARHLLALINDVLDISKIEAGQLEVYRKPFDLRAALEKAVAGVMPLAAQKGLAMQAHVAADVAEVVSDRRRVEQVVINLLNNAIKFTEHGSITLTAERVPDFAVPAGDAPASAPQAAVCIRVADTGMGIKPEDLMQLFQPFRQIDTGLTRQHEGTGLGLAICRRLADLLSGEIRVESEWGQGSVFTFTLPLAGPATQPSPPHVFGGGPDI
jgi:PAS domain S-box-containing protein